MEGAHLRWSIVQVGHGVDGMNDKIKPIHEDDDEVYYPVLWIPSYLVSRTMNRVLGICYYSRRVFWVTSIDNLKTFIVNNVRVFTDNSFCEECKRCIDFDCRYNRTTWTSLRMAREDIPPELRRKDIGKTIRWNVSEKGNLLDYQDIIASFPDGGHVHVIEDFDNIDSMIDKPKRQRKLIPSSQRFRILNRDGNKCCLCGRGPADGIKLEIDHIIPVAKGGSNDDDNLCVMCSECNAGKSAQLLSPRLEFAIRAMRGG